MRRYVNMAKSGRMAATRRVTPAVLRPVAKDATSRRRERRTSVPPGAGKRAR